MMLVSLQIILYFCVLSEIGVMDCDRISQVMQPVFLDMESEPVQKLCAKLREISLTTGWEPDVTKNYYIEHSRHDNYVPIQSVRNIIPWMTEKGLSRSNLPVNYTLFDLIPDIGDVLAKVDLTTDDLEEMCNDAGISQVDILMAYAYLMTEEETEEAPAATTTLEERVEAPLFLLRSYEQTLANWFKLAGYDVNYELGGM